MSHKRGHVQLHRNADGSAASIRPDIQSLRGLAVLLVVLYHSGLGFSGGFVGVDIFFVISGFVIASSLMREIRDTGSVALGSFYRRRIRRLMPALALVSVVTLILAALFVPFAEQRYGARTALAATFFSANLYLYRSGGGYFDPADQTNPFLHTWSLSLEEQFYFVLPGALLVLWFFVRKLRVQKPELAVSITLAGIAVVSFWISRQTTYGNGFFADRFESFERFAFYLPLSRFWEFLVGVVLAIFTAGQSYLWRWGSVVRIGGFAGILWSALFFDEATAFPGTWAAVPVLATACVISSGPVGHPTQALFAVIRGRVASVFGFLGDISYSWYLWHWPAIVFVKSLWPSSQLLIWVVALLSIVPAYLSKLFLEDPIRYRPTQRSRYAIAVAATCLIIPALSAIAVDRGARAQWGRETEPAWVEQRLAGLLGCVDTEDVVHPPENCLVRVPASGGSVLIVGDSHASSASDGLAAAAGLLNLDYGFWVKSGCPMLFQRSIFDYESCPAWQNAALNWIESVKPSVVVIANRSAAYRPDGSWRTIATASGGKPSSLTEAASSWSEGLSGLISRLNRQGIAVVVFSNVPEYPWANGGFRESLFGRSDENPPSISRQEVDIARNWVLDVERTIIDRNDRAYLFDPADLLCRNGMCHAGSPEGIWWYMDGHHLNPQGSVSLSKALAEVIGRALSLPD